MEKDLIMSNRMAAKFPLIFQKLVLPELAPGLDAGWLPRYRRAGPSTSLDKRGHAVMHLVMVIRLTWLWHTVNQSVLSKIYEFQIDESSKSSTTRLLFTPICGSGHIFT
jgi:hypothetical protein